MKEVVAVLIPTMKLRPQGWIASLTQELSKDVFSCYVIRSINQRNQDSEEPKYVEEQDQAFNIR